MSLLVPIPGERFSVKAHSPTIGDFGAIHIFYKAADCDDATPTVIVGNGYDYMSPSLSSESRKCR